MIQELDRLNIDAYHEIVECITSALDARDPYTAGHSERVSDLAQMICGEMGITGECQNDIHVAAHLHDIGKITKRLNVIDKSIIVILNKLTKGKLKSIKTSKKIQCYYNHSSYGYEILKDIIDDTVILDIVKNHHSDNGNNLVNFFKQIDDKN